MSFDVATSEADGVGPCGRWTGAREAHFHDGVAVSVTAGRAAAPVRAPLMEPQYYKDRLGFNEPVARNGRDSLDRRRDRDRDSVDRRDQRDRNGQPRQTNGVPVAAHLQYETNVGYEENLSKFKGTA